MNCVGVDFGAYQTETVRFLYHYMQILWTPTCYYLSAFVVFHLRLSLKIFCENCKNSVS